MGVLRRDFKDKSGILVVSPEVECHPGWGPWASWSSSTFDMDTSQMSFIVEVGLKWLIASLQHHGGCFLVCDSARQNSWFVDHGRLWQV
jgi:hypothetical protein